jgi:hypothetical protein
LIGAMVVRIQPPLAGTTLKCARFMALRVAIGAPPQKGLKPGS